MAQLLYITKASGERVPFSEKKLRRSLKRSGAEDAVIEEVLAKLRSEFHEGITTQKIYRKAFALLKRSPHPSAARYKLKPAIMELGPSGYPFEQFVGELFKSKGYQVQVGQIVQGCCVQHEVDVVAETDHRQIMVECKFRNRPGYICDVKVPLYIDSRFRDIRNQWQKQTGNHNRDFEGWIVTNTRFSSDAIQYAECVGLKLLSWDYPQERNLKDWIDASGLYPITALTTLKSGEKKILLDNQLVLCRDLLTQQDKLLQWLPSQTSRHAQDILKECQQLCAKTQQRFKEK